MTIDDGRKTRKNQNDKKQSLQKSCTRMMLRALLAPVLMIGLLFFVAGRWVYWANDHNRLMN